MSSLYTLGVNPLSDILFTENFSHSVGCLFILLMVFFAVQKLLFLMYSQLFIFALCCDSWGRKESDMTERLIWSDTIQKKSLPRSMSRSLLPMFSPRSFMLSGLMFKYLIHFELICLCGLRYTFILFIWLSSFPNTIYWRDCPFSIFMFLAPLE